MIYELKTKIRHSRLGEKLVSKLEKTSIFPFCYRILAYMGLTEAPAYITKNRKERRMYFTRNQDKIRSIVETLEDKKSKEIFSQIIKCRFEGYFLWHEGGTLQDQYFPKDIIHLSPEEVFVDCGAYTGDTILKFKEETKNQYKKIVAFEPDPENFITLLKEKTENSFYFNEGVWDKKGKISFWASGTMGSSFVMDREVKQISVPVCPLDEVSCCSDMTFLKMDIEGAELNALKGAKKTICKNKPKLAICIYHSDQDMIDIPLWIMSLNMGYKLYVRHHHEKELVDTVLYAI